VEAFFLPSGPALFVNSLREAVVLPVPRWPVFSWHYVPVLFIALRVPGPFFFVSLRDGFCFCPAGRELVSSFTA
jgi:hypothetical protein